MVSEKHRKLQRQHRKRRERKTYLDETSQTSVPESEYTGFIKFYHDKYKSLFLITVALLILSLAVIGFTYVNTGDVIYKGVSLSGGLTLTVPATDVSVPDLAQELITRFPDADFAVREISEFGSQVAVVVEAAPRDTSAAALTDFEKDLKASLMATLPNVQSEGSSEIIGSSLGESFFKQTAKAVLVAFTLMGLVVFLYFGETMGQKVLVTLLTLVEGFFIWYSGNLVFAALAAILGVILVVMYVRFSIPSAAVILAAISTLLFTVAVVDLLHMRISTAGIAAFLMLIGYSVDTDILLSTRVLRRQEGTVFDRVLSTVKTGLTMECTTLIVALVSIIVTQSPVIKEIMIIVFIGLIADIFFTWIQNVGILRLYIERRESK